MKQNKIKTLAFGVNGLELKAIFEKPRRTESDRSDVPNYHGIHDHVNYEVFLVPDGEVELITEGGSTVYSESVLIVPPRFRHFSVIRGRVEVFFLGVSRLSRTEELAKVEEVLDCGRISVMPLDGRKAELYRGLFYALGSSSGCSEQKASAFLQLLFSDLLEYFGVYTDKSDGGAREDDYFSVVEDFVNRRYAEGGGLNELSDLLGLSRRQTSRVVRHLYGEPLTAVMRNKRLSVAAVLLKNTDKTVTEIAEELGYASRSKFYCDFKSRYGTTPLRSRKERGSRDE